jgi:hypothetical protein
MRFIIFITLLTTTSFLIAQPADSTKQWETYKENVFSISYPTTNWVKTNEMSARFCIATKATEAKAYDRDLIKIYVMDNEDGLHGDVDSFTRQYTRELVSDKQTQLVSSERIKKGQLEYHEIIAKSLVGKLKRQWKERYYFINGKIIHIVFDAKQTVYDALLSEADSILNTLISTDFAATTVAKWLVFDNANLSFTYPNNWQMSETPPQHTIFQLWKPKKSDDKGFRDNMYLAENIFKESIPELGNYTQRATEQLKMTLKNAQIIRSVRKKSGTLAYQEVISEGLLGTHTVKMKQWHFVKGKRAYSLTFVARAEKFEESTGIIEDIFKSFRLK